MPEIHIPGVTSSRYKTDELVDGLMRIERVPRDRADDQLQLYKNQQNAWRQLSRQVTSLRDSARALYSFTNPFTDRIGNSSDDRAVSVTATRDAAEQDFSVSVVQMAKADSFLSKEVARDATVPAGTYVFSVGQKNIEFSWKGGSYPEFVKAINRRGEDTIRAQLVQTSPGGRALLIESLKTGADQKLGFREAARDLAIDIGIIERKLGASVSVTEEDVSIQPGKSQVIPFSDTAKASSNYVLEYTVSSEEIAKTEEIAQEEESAAYGPGLLVPGLITYSGVTIINEDSEMYLPAVDDLPTELAQDESAENNASLALRSTKQGASIPLPDIPESGSQTFRVPLGELGDVNAIIANNNNADRSLRIYDMVISDPEATGGFGPVNPVSTAQDAIIEYEGIKITRSNNNIDDLVPGVTLNVRGESEKPISISIAPNKEAAKEAIIAFVANYNRVIAEINILTQNKPEIISEIQYFNQEEREQAEQRLGMMQGETMLMTLKSALQRITSNAYTDDEDSVFSLLAQIGISTRADSGAGIDSSRLRGYLEINENILDTALENSMQSVKSLFGFDSDGDLVIDSGAAVVLDNNIAPYIQTGGIFATRTAGLDTRISETERKITQLDQQLDRKEADLRQRYHQMEGTLNRLESQMESISNFNRRSMQQQNSSR